MEEVVLVDENDQQIGTAEKLDAHKNPRLHRAFSIYVLNAKKELMLQFRAPGKYHSGGLWTNTCCGHNRPNEDINDATHRRLVEEMGFDCPLHKAFTTIYRTPFDNGMTEHEFLHVYFGCYEGDVQMNPEEATQYKWMSFEAIKEDMVANPHNYTEWFKVLFKEHWDKLLKARDEAKIC